ncbi:ornithine cyclodeaminase [Amylibacter sp. IMCC11727]|uniref:ornithine cyclodeaminase family protein n=1 Tax=Amylibacter sp. IMCC11727 TaxID=3039851 RepID=UPI00244E3BF3|nr:ornithine cyclodeaminase [Amylibacter sp. IMCC11727]WGI21975.1 ornithine cyclodeaminase [Amylibacter sp. IMCC11727]
MDIPFIGFDEMDNRLTWRGVTEALRNGHKLAAASIADGFAYRGDDTLLSRAAWIDGLGVAVKSATVIPGNVAKGRPMIHGGVMVFDDEFGTLEAVIDFHLVTKWKTAGDSLLGAQMLARPDSKMVLIVGAGTVARNLVSAYSSAFPEASFLIWNRTAAKAEELATDLSKSHDIKTMKSLEEAVSLADIVSCATMSTEPVLRGDWLRAGQHVDLIGAYRPDMREVDDTALNRAQVFVDSRATTVGHIGELKIPIANGVFSEDDIQGEFYDLVAGTAGRETDDDITLFKNGGGAHLDLMTAKYILAEWSK